ncbi:hypothetical protein KKH39_03125 [Patescibacteria group bacterium]|nr:hypothetical protein [Patescibacteria group bacterium]
MKTKTKTKITNIWQTIKKINAFTVVLLVGMLMTMLISTNYANSQNLERTDLSKEIKALEDELRLLNASISELQTTGRIEEESQRLNLVKIQAEDIYYLAANADRVALK